jgi:hypothetical protein
MYCAGIADSFESVNNVSHCTIIEIIVVNNFSSGFPPSTKTSPFSPENVRECRNHPRPHAFLFEGNETRRVRGTDTRSTVLDRLAAEEVSKQKSQRGPRFNAAIALQIGDVL